MSERDSRGRFAKGNQGGPGRPRHRSQAVYRDVTLEHVELHQWQAVVARAVEDARVGDTQARRWLSDYLIGRPTVPPVVAGIETPVIERVFEALRAADYDPLEVLETIADRLKRRQEELWNDRRNARR